MKRIIGLFLVMCLSVISYGQIYPPNSVVDMPSTITFTWDDVQPGGPYYFAMVMDYYNHPEWIYIVDTVVYTSSVTISNLPERQTHFWGVWTDEGKINWIVSQEVSIGPPPPPPPPLWDGNVYVSGITGASLLNPVNVVITATVDGVEAGIWQNMNLTQPDSNLVMWGTIEGLNVVYSTQITNFLGYSIKSNPVISINNNANSNTIWFDIKPDNLLNLSRGNGFWQKQFDEVKCGRQNHDCCEHERHRKNKYDRFELDTLITLVQEHYTPHFDYFANDLTINDWHNLLTVKGRTTIQEKAKKQIGTMLLNLVSGKIGQSTVISDDGRTLGHLLTYISDLYANLTIQNATKIRRLCAKVNDRDHLLLATDIPADWRVLLYKGTEWTFDKINTVEVPVEYSLMQNYPNPFNPTTTIKFSLPTTDIVSLKVFDVLGQVVASPIMYEGLDAGIHVIKFDASHLASGVYMYMLKTSKFTDVKKMVLMK